MSYKGFQRFLHSTIFSLLVLLVLVGVLAGIAYFVTATYQKNPDFGGMVTLRQADMKLDPSEDSLQLTRGIILDHITSQMVLEPIATRCGWDCSYDEMVKSIDVRDRLSSQNSYIVIAHTGNAERSAKVAYELALSFLDFYRKQWNERGKLQTLACAERIDNFNQELCRLKKLKLRFQDHDELRPLNTEIEMTALNSQLVEAQNQFMKAYGNFISNMNAKRAELQLEYDMSKQIYSEDYVEVKNMKLRLDELARQCENIQKSFTSQSPNIYQMTVDSPKLEGVPNDVLYYYENVQTLQQMKLALMLNSLIEDKEKMLKQEQQNKTTLERLLANNSCDVFIREVSR